MATGKIVRKYWAEISREAVRRSISLTLGNAAKTAITVVTLLLTIAAGYELAARTDASWIYKPVGSVIAMALVIGVVYLSCLLSIPVERETVLVEKNAALQGRRDTRALLEVIGGIADEARKLMRSPNFMSPHWVNEAMEWRRNSIRALDEIDDLATCNLLASFPTRESLRQVPGNPPAAVLNAFGSFLPQIEQRESEIEASLMDRQS
jgi:hypothetical protein